jgi:site-specific DNA-methyltransferase (adenine-specific)
MHQINLQNSDCLIYLKTLEDNSVDSVVTDPPYGLSFMGKKWDYDVPSQQIWEECLRVLKPGGYLLAFAGTRTQHRMAVRIEDAGFEIRDMIAWVYGSGFPKSLNIGKAVDKLQGNEREDAGRYQSPEGTSGNKGSSTCFQGTPRDGLAKLTKGNSPYEGWGTALKPALEPITVARKPLSEKTVAENCLKWGTGGINIDECRVGFADGEREKLFRPMTENNSIGWKNTSKAMGYNTPDGLPPAQGRFPANLIHDGSDEVVGLFPETGKSSGGRIGNKGSALNMMGNTYEAGNPGFGDSGSASRFFYCAKASKSERNKGCEEFEEKPKVFNGQSAQPSIEMKGVEQKFTTQPSKNNHPTVKPISLMRYLCRLVTPKGGTVLDPFMGSGTTGIACINLNCNFIGIEMDKDYFEIAKARIENINKN